MSFLPKWFLYLDEQIKNHSIYVWGAQGQKAPTITEAWIRKMETTQTNANRAIAFWNKQVKAGYGDVLRAFDCSGLCMFYFQNTLGYFSGDMTSNGIMGKCETITKSQLLPGDFVFRVNSAKRAYHIGFVIGDGRVTEAKGRDDGVVCRDIDASGSGYWNRFGRPLWMKDEIEGQTPAPETWTVSRLLKLASPMMRGDDVKNLQAALKSAGFSPGSVDGVFGSGTQTAVKAFQKSAGLTADGVAGKDTVTALGGKWTGSTPVVTWTVSRLLKLTSPLMRGDDVKNLQAALKPAGFSPGSVDGIFGSGTQAAVKAFQKSAGLTADGVAGKDTVTALGGKWNG